MTIAATSMSFLARERTPHRAVAELSPKTRDFEADARIRQLTEAVARGDEAAFESLYTLFHQRIFRLILVLARGDEILAQEVTQAVFMTAAAKLGRIESEQHLWNWLAQVARQHLGKVWRQRRHDSPIVLVAELPEHAGLEATDAAIEECLDAALQTLDASERQLVEWFYFDQLSHREIAGRLTTSPKAVSSRLERAREKLRSTITRRLSRET